MDWTDFVIWLVIGFIGYGLGIMRGIYKERDRIANALSNPQEVDK